MDIIDFQTAINQIIVVSHKDTKRNSSCLCVFV